MFDSLLAWLDDLRISVEHKAVVVEWVVVASELEAGCLVVSASGHTDSEEDTAYMAVGGGVHTPSFSCSIVGLPS